MWSVWLKHVFRLAYQPFLSLSHYRVSCEQSMLVVCLAPWRPSKQLKEQQKRNQKHRRSSNIPLNLYPTHIHRKLQDSHTWMWHIYLHICVFSVQLFLRLSPPFSPFARCAWLWRLKKTLKKKSGQKRRAMGKGKTARGKPTSARRNWG